MIYLDHSATTPLHPQVLEAMLPWLRDEYGNASSVHAYGRKARVAIEDARSEVAAAIGAYPSEVTFTSGGTESCNAVIFGCTGISNLADQVWCGATEHHAVLSPLHTLERKGAQAGVIPVDGSGAVMPESVRSLDHPRSLICVMMVNNETGLINNVQGIREALPQSLLFTDAVQALGKVPVHMGELKADFASFSAHKINGPKGVGALFVRRGIDFKAYQQGGGQERNRRAGTEAVASIVGFASAVRLTMDDFEANTKHMSRLRDILRTRIVATIPDVRINTPEHSAPHILNVSFTDAAQFDGEAILQLMDMRGVAVSNGSACVSGSLQPSHVLLAMGVPSSEARAAVRFSVGRQTTEDDVASAVTILSDVVRALRVGTHS